MLVFSAGVPVGMGVTCVTPEACEGDEEDLSMSEGYTLLSMDYEVWGKVPGVFSASNSG